jgi:hypothetical protein
MNQFIHASDPEAYENIFNVVAGFLTYPINQQPSHPDSVGAVAIECR